MIITSDVDVGISPIDADVIKTLARVVAGIVERDVRDEQLGASGHQMAYPDSALFLQPTHTRTGLTLRH